MLRTEGNPEWKIKFRILFPEDKQLNGNCPRKEKGVDVPCPPGTTAAGDIPTEYLGDDFLVGRGLFDPTLCSSNLGVAVLYR